MASQEVEAGLSQLMSLRISPELIAAREMLQLPSIALEAAVESELGDNPALDRDPHRAARQVRSGVLRDADETVAVGKVRQISQCVVWFTIPGWPPRFSMPI